MFWSIRPGIAKINRPCSPANRAVIIARESLTFAGETREVERVLVYRVEGDHLAECWVYDADQRFIDRALSA